ncbi:regulator of G protein signaling domain-containing protein [Elsinoe ampelina]|uniref:Regulator of G protein signaling domain-containing protein n=1 Tax=Elsinoe ampelina TaxID=302913 RepID=A0A6A6G3B9_9PEZI|nr:regulator of G protein signaling domain-containing protein [Elsinoe ampelina]
MGAVGTQSPVVGAASQLKTTQAKRPFTKDFKSLFAMLMINLFSLRPDLQGKARYSFTSQEAIIRLQKLQFSRNASVPGSTSNTITTTTYSMSELFATQMWEWYAEARFVEQLTAGGYFTSAKSTWQLTRKGIRVLSRFVLSNGVNEEAVTELLQHERYMLPLVILERDDKTDKIFTDRTTTELIFRRFAGARPNTKDVSNKVSAASTDSNILAGIPVTVTPRSPPANSLYQFNGHACLDWILDNCMVTSEQEALAIANLFLRHGLISAEQEKEDFELGTLSGFSARTSAIYRITDRGLDSTIWELSPRQSMDTSRGTHSREAQSNSDKLLFILGDPALRLVFREFLDLRQCEENLTFYYEVKEVMETWASIKSAPEAQMETVIASVHSLYNAFLVDNAVSEVNLGSRLRKDLQASVCDLFQTPDEKATLLRATLDLFLAAQDSIFGLMASDCVPLFLQQQGNDRLYMDRSVQRGITLQAH